MVFLFLGSPISCLDILNRAGYPVSDGEYDVWIRGKMARIYCSGMETGNPLEYITLKAGARENYSEIYNKR